MALSTAFGGPETGASAIVLAGSHYWGSGTFERALRGPLLSVAQQPLLAYPLRWLRAGGLHSATICAGRATRAVEAQLGAGDAGVAPGLALTYYEDVQPRGPAGCARDAATASSADRFVLVEGALVPALDLRALLAAHRRSGAAATTVVEIDRRRPALGGQRAAMPGGIYVFERRVFDAVPDTGFQDIKQGLLERLYASGERVVVHESAGVSPRVLDFATYAAVSSWLVSTASSRPDLYGGWEVNGELCRHPSAFVHPSARLIGPVLVGPGARIEADAVVVGPTSVGAHAVVGAGAVVSRSVLWERSLVDVGAEIDGSLVADGAVVAPGTRVARDVVAAPEAPAAAPAPNGHPAPTRTPSPATVALGVPAPFAHAAS